MNRKIVPLFFLVFLSVLLTGSALFYVKSAESALPTVNSESPYLKDRILVKYRLIKDVVYVNINREDDYESVLSDFRNDPDVEYAEPDFKYHAAIIPSDTYYNNQWYLEKIKANKAWDVVRESPGIVIAVIDSGVQITHPDLRDNIWENTDEIPGNELDDDNNGFVDDINGWDFVNYTSDPSPKWSDNYTDSGILHGTIVAGVAAASGNNAAGVTGVTWRARIMPLKVLDDAGDGDTLKVVKAIDYAVMNGADIINLSFIGYGYSRTLNEAIRRAYNAGVIVVAAAGNEQENGQATSLNDKPLYPACHDGPGNENWVIGVAATDGIDQKTEFSGYGYKCIDIAAPGISIFSTAVYAPGKQYDGNLFNKYYDGYWSGTSMATPMVSAAVALIEGANPRLNRNQVIEILIGNTDNINRINPEYFNQLGRGRLNVFSSVKAAREELNGYTTVILTTPHQDMGSKVRISDRNGDKLSEFEAYNENFLGGVNVAVGDVDGDGTDEIVTGAGFTGGPHVRVWSGNGELKAQFFAYDERFRGGVNVAVGDVDGDGTDEIVTGAGFTGGPHVRVWSGNGRVEGQFFAYNKDFRGGVRLAVANIDGGGRDHKKEIITAPGPGGGPQIRIFNNHAEVQYQFFAYKDKFRGGIDVAAGDIDNDGLDEIITGAGPGGGPHVRIFSPTGQILESFYAFDRDFEGGVNVGMLEIKS